jgi:hypothetical protein
MTRLIERRRLVMLGFGLLGVQGSLFAAPKKKRDGPLGLIAGTVFQSNGRLLPGAKVVAVSEADPKIREEAFTARRGEFVLRVPADARYVVTASAKGFESQEKTTEVYEAQKSTVTFLLSPRKRK